MIDEVAATGQPVVVTKRGKPVVELVPYRPELRADGRPKKCPLGIWKGKVEFVGDIISPLDVDWDAMK
ncbi:MAG TPA: type II toxin-antitoxin system Phd/YefM family antitoxin [Pseudolabrys sp.]|nr:type II toxin-antitoxin system Phd/YefM family antitoxin [Pseudolabrys sp.]